MFICTEVLEAIRTVLKDLNKDPKAKLHRVKAAGIEIKDSKVFIVLKHPKFKPRFVEFPLD